MKIQQKITITLDNKQKQQQQFGITPIITTNVIIDDV